MRTQLPAKRILAAAACTAALSLFTAVPALAVPAADNPGQGGANSNAAEAQSTAPGQVKQTPATTDAAAVAEAIGAGANQSGPFDSTSDGSPSENGNGNGNAFGKPCAGCVGNADDKNPPGQVKNGKDNGYECDGNNGVGKGNPAHSSCKPGEEPPGEEPPGENPPGVNPPGVNPPGEHGKPEVTPVAQTGQAAAEKSDDSGLAFTGASVLAPAFAGLALVGAGGAAIAVTRRRRVD